MGNNGLQLGARIFEALRGVEGLSRAYAITAMGELTLPYAVYRKVNHAPLYSKSGNIGGIVTYEVDVVDKTYPLVLDVACRVNGNMLGRLKGSKEYFNDDDTYGITLTYELNYNE